MQTTEFLTSDLAKRLYQSVAELPIIDYHNHLSLSEHYRNITELWLKSDPYKHRLMRICGVPEREITGDASDEEKFRAWCKIFPSLIGTPVYDWSRMEIAQIFGMDIFPSEETADRLWREMNAKLPEITLDGILKQCHVEYLSPVASIVDDISWYRTRNGYAPSLRGDDILSPTPAFVEKLSNVANTAISSLDDFMNAIRLRLEEFIKAGCRFTDHALDDGFSYIPEYNPQNRGIMDIPDESDADDAFTDMLNGRLTAQKKILLTSEILRRLGCLYAKNNLVMQLHLGAMRFTSDRLRRIAGATGGFAGIGRVDLSHIVRFLDDIERRAGTLPKVILFPLHPSDMEATAILSGSFSKDGYASVISEGPAWWWCDNRGGMERLFGALSYYATFGSFVGMTTDSRSPLSIVRHDYFRRLVCDWIAGKVMCGELPNREDDIKAILYAVCYGNAEKLVRGE